MDTRENIVLNEFTTAREGVYDIDKTYSFTNRGVAVSIHWLSVTFFSGMNDPMTHLLNQFFGYDIKAEFEWQKHFYNTNKIDRGYRVLYIGPERTRLYGFPFDGGKHCHLEIPGSVIEKYGTEHSINYLRSLYQQNFNWRCKRIDIAFDHLSFTPRDCYEAHQKGNVKAKCHKNSWDWRKNSEGSTLYIGSRKSDRYILVYDRRGFTRLELVLKNIWAKSFAKEVAERESEKLPYVGLGCLKDYINFADNNSGIQRRDDVLLLPWWDDFIGDVDNFSLNTDRHDNSFHSERLKSYFNSLKPTLFLIKYALDIDVDKEIDGVANNLTPRNKHKLEILQSEQSRKLLNQVGNISL